MSTPATHLLTETELTLLAAIGGLEGFLSFRSDQPQSQAELVRAAYQLLQRGALVQKDGKVGLSDALVPIFRCVGAAASAVLLTPRSSAAPQLCLYCAGTDAVYVMPHETKRDSLRLGLTPAEELPELLEELGLLPAPFLAEGGALAPLREKDIPVLTLPLDVDGRVRDWESLGEAVLTVLERFSLPDGKVRARAAIFRAPITWGFAVFSDHPEYRAYEPGDVLHWIGRGIF